MIKTNFHTYTIPILFGILFSCTAPIDKVVTESINNKNELEEITPLIETEVWLYDTNKSGKFIHPNLPMDKYPKRYLSYPAFTSLINQIKQTFNDPNALIYFDPESDSTSSLMERKNLIIKHDSIVFWRGINIIKFYESWQYNKHTGEIVKKQLGYTVLQFDYEKEAPREWYYFFTSKATRIKYLKNS